MNKIKETRQKLTRLLEYANKSQYKRVLSDIDNFNNMMATLGKEEIPLVNRRGFKIAESTYLDYFNSYNGVFIPLVCALSKIFEKYPAEEAEAENIYIKYADEIVYNFLEENLKPLIYIYETLKKEKHILYKKLDGTRTAYAYTMPEIDENYIIIGKECKKKDYECMCCLVHELMHIYNSEFLKNYKSSALEELNAGLKAETTSLYTDFLFNDFLNKEKIFLNKNKYERNFLLANYLDVVEDISNLLYVIELSINDKKSLIDFVTDFDYEITCPEFETQGSIISFRYALGYTEALELYKKGLENNTILKNINDYLIEMQDIKCYDKLINNAYDYDFIKKVMKKNYKNMKKMSN